jgi:integrase
VVLAAPVGVVDLDDAAERRLIVALFHDLQQFVTVRELRAMKEGDRLSESAGRGQGTLWFRKTGGRVRVYFRFTKPDGSRDELPIGWYDENGRDGWTLIRVREEAARIREQYQSGSGDVRADQDAERAAREVVRRTAEAAQVEAERKAKERQQFTLGALCGAYCTMLEARGKAASAKHARSMFKHVPEDIAGLPANEITTRQLGGVIRAVHECGKERAAGILRSYLRAAYAAAVTAETDPSIPSTFIGFNVESNPVADIKAGKVRAGDRTLSREELRAYMGHLGDGIIDRALRLALLAGGQRLSQILRARVSDWDGSTLRLWDSKGRRSEPREHLIPLAGHGAELVDLLVARARERAEEGDPNPSLFISRGARVTDSTPGKRVAEIAKAMGGEPFDARDIRRTVETLLARMGISMDVRAQLLSHGLSGVQVQHYDRHGYMGEKARALEAWERELGTIQAGETGSNVVRMRRTNDNA